MLSLPSASNVICPALTVRRPELTFGSPTFPGGKTLLVLLPERESTLHFFNEH